MAIVIKYEIIPVPYHEFVIVGHTPKAEYSLQNGHWKLWAQEDCIWLNW